MADQGEQVMKEGRWLEIEYIGTDEDLAKAGATDLEPGQVRSRFSRDPEDGCAILDIVIGGASVLPAFGPNPCAAWVRVRLTDREVEDLHAGADSILNVERHNV